VVPEGGSVALLHLRAPLDGDVLADHLRVRHSLLAVPGRFFETPRAVRVSFGVPPAVFREGLARLARALDELGGAV
jgi:DNA-binding transcriptional MocR family regulator